MSNWDILKGQLIDGAFAVEKLISEGETSALFRAKDTRVDPPREVLVAVFRNAPDELLKRYQEAAFLRHKHILRIWQTGRMADRGSVYAASEPAEYDLPQFLEHRPMPVEDAKELAEQVIAALDYLHQYSLVFCGLRTEAVWKNGNDWLLADFRQLRVAGEATPRDMQHALARNPEVPPEAYQGIISPAWDVWSLGVLLRAVLTPEPHHVPGSLSVPGKDSSLPAPFDEIVRDCLEPNPDDRITTGEILQRLAKPASAPPPAPAVLESPSAARMQEYRNRSEETHSRVPMVLGIAALLMVSGVGITWFTGKKTETPPPAVADTSSPDGSRSRVTSPSERVIPSIEEDKVREQLGRWVAAMRSQDAEAKLNCYVPVLDTYMGRRKIRREEVLDKGLMPTGVVRKFDVSNVQVTVLNPAQAVILLDKSWDYGEKRRTAGSARVQLTLAKLGREWKITGERQLNASSVRPPRHR